MKLKCIKEIKENPLVAYSVYHWFCDTINNSFYSFIELGSHEKIVINFLSSSPPMTFLMITRVKNNINIGAWRVAINIINKSIKYYSQEYTMP